MNGIAAGILEMPWWASAYNALGAALWVGCWEWGIYYLDEHGRAILEFIRQLNPWVAAVTLVGIILLLAYGGYRWRHQHRAGS